MNEEEIKDIMEDIFKDENLCLIREALRSFKKVE